MSKSYSEEFAEEEVWSVMRDRESDNSPSPKKKKKKSKKKDDDCSSSAWQHQSSSPVINIPDWSKIYGPTNVSKWVYDHDHDHDHDHGGDEDDDEMVPPHEWVAKKLAGTQISSASMCEGLGRTLKGRDLSKVRNAVLTKTGFLEQ